MLKMLKVLIAIFYILIDLMLLSIITSFTLLYIYYDLLRDTGTIATIVVVLLGIGMLLVSLVRALGIVEECKSESMEKRLKTIFSLSDKKLLEDNKVE